MKCKHVKRFHIHKSGRFLKTFASSVYFCLLELILRRRLHHSIWYVYRYISNTSQTCLRVHLHQRGAGPPADAGSVFRAGLVFTLARVRAQFHFTGAPFRGTGSLIYKYRPISAPYSCGSRGRIAPWAIFAGARRGGRAGPRRCKQHHTIPSNRSTAEPAGGIRSGAPRVFRVGVNAP